MPLRVLIKTVTVMHMTLRIAIISFMVLRPRGKGEHGWLVSYALLLGVQEAFAVKKRGSSAWTTDGLFHRYVHYIRGRQSVSLLRSWVIL
jgi:hypothetical protein